jgi:hypothetical protein
VEPEVLASIASVLAASGPYGLVVALSWAFWRSNEKKDAELRELSQQVVRMVEAQTAATEKVEAALVSLRGAIEVLGRTETNR